jgi:PAS domain S-box-containing protein
MARFRFEALLEAAPDAMVIVDPTGAIVLVNSQAEKLFGYPRDELLGRSIDLLVPPRYRGAHAAHRSSYAREPRVRAMGTGVELHAQRKDGTEFPAEISLSPVESDEGPLVISAIRDLTERRRAQRREIELKEIHHRVKNNLQVITSLLRLHAEQMTTPEAKEAFEDAQRRVRAIALVHEQLHDARGGGPVQLQPYAKTLVESLVGASMVEVRPSVEADGVKLSLDQALPVGLVLNELVTNALKYAFPPGRSGPRHLWVRGALENDHVTLEVADDGVGWPDEPREGALGLRLVKTLCRQLEGQVTFSNSGGAVASLRFPREA